MGESILINSNQGQGSIARADTMPGTQVDRASGRMSMRKMPGVALLIAIPLALAACESSAPDKYDVTACKGLKQTIAQLPNGTVGSAGTQDEVALMGWQAIAHDPRLKSDIQGLEQSLALANPGAGAYSQAGYDGEDAAVGTIGQVCADDGVNGIANGW